MMEYMSVVKGLMQAVFPIDTSCISCKSDLELNNRHLCVDCSDAVQLVSGPVCDRCGHPLDPYRVGILCKNCLSEEDAFFKVRSCFEYNDTVKSLIHRLKYSDQTYLARYFAEDMAMCFEQLGWRIDAVIGVPSYLHKTWQKGYHVAELLALFFSQQMTCEYLTGAVIKTRETPSQVSLTGAERRCNLKGAFEATMNLEYFPNVLLIDDLFTTGSTMNEVAKTLKKAGVDRVYGLSLATSKRE